MYNIGVIGCGAILPRHIEAIEENENFNLIAVCDIDNDALQYAKSMYSVNGYKNYKTMMAKNPNINLIVVATPNSLHFDQASYALENNCDVLIEKPVSLDPKEVRLLSSIAERNSQKAYTVLQVRLNPTVSRIKDMLQSNILGKIRGVGLIQRWQRPFDYFTGWRAEPLIGGGTLYECGIHYMDIMCYLFGKPNVESVKIYNTKHLECDIEDTIYSILDFKDYGGTLEITISSEPSNLECSISIIAENGYIKIGGRALDSIEEAKFINKDIEKQYKKIINGMEQSKAPNSYGTHQGSCPNHPSLYKNMNSFDLTQSENVIDLIDEIYKKTDKQYY